MSSSLLVVLVLVLVVLVRVVLVRVVLLRVVLVDLGAGRTLAGRGGWDNDWLLRGRYDGRDNRSRGWRSCGWGRYNGEGSLGGGRLSDIILCLLSSFLGNAGLILRNTLALLRICLSLFLGTFLGVLSFLFSLRNSIIGLLLSLSFGISHSLLGLFELLRFLCLFCDCGGLSGFCLLLVLDAGSF